MDALTIKYPNSAGRMLALFDRLQITKSAVAGNFLIKALTGQEVPKQPREFAILSAQSLRILHSMYDEFLEDMYAVGIPEDELTVLMTGIEPLAILMYHQQIGAQLRAVSAAELALLEVCATRLPKENVINEDDIESILKSISDLKSEIQKLTKGSILRVVLLELVRLSEDSINRFDIYGSKGLKQAFKGMLAEVAEIYMQDEVDVTELKDSSAWEKAITHLRSFDSLASKAGKYKPIIESMSNLLT